MRRPEGAVLLEAYALADRWHRRPGEALDLPMAEWDGWHAYLEIVEEDAKKSGV